MSKSNKKKARRPPAKGGATVKPPPDKPTPKPSPKPPAPPPQRRGRTRWRITRPERFLSFLILAVLLALLLLLSLRKGPPARTDYEPNVMVGTMPGKSETAIQAELNETATDKTFAVNYNYKPVFEDGAAEGPILFENSAYNAGKLLRLEVYLGPDDAGRLIYQTGLLRSGTFVNEDALDVDLAAGTYDCTAYIYAYRESDESLIGKVSGSMVVTVLH